VEITTATRSGGGPDGSEDLVVAGGHFALLLDGTGADTGAGTGAGTGTGTGEVGGCGHGAGGLVKELGSRLADGLIRNEDAPLGAMLRRAFESVREAHRLRCSSTPARGPVPPSAMVAVLRERGHFLDLLVLGGVTALVQFPDLTVNAVRGRRPAAGGATEEVPAVVGSLPAKDVHRVCLLSGGAYRLAEPYEKRWPLLLDQFGSAGPDAFVSATPYDDASVALCVPRL
jgi:hypothetical protein